MPPKSRTTTHTHKHRPQLGSGLPGTGPYSLCAVCRRELLTRAQPALQVGAADWWAGEQRVHGSSSWELLWANHISASRSEVLFHLAVGSVFLPVTSPAHHLPHHGLLPPRPSCHQLSPDCDCLVLQPSPIPEKPSAQDKVPLTAKFMEIAVTERIPKQPREPELEGSWSHQSPACRPLPAGFSFSAQHKRSCCDYQRVLWAPGQERLASRHPHPSTLRGRGPGHRQPASLV